MNRFRENFKSFNFWPRNVPFTPFWAKQEFSLTTQNCHFYPPFNALGNEFTKLDSQEPPAEPGVQQMNVGTGKD